MRCDIDIAWVELAQLFDGVLQVFESRTLKWGQHFKRKSRCSLADEFCDFHDVQN